MRRQRDGLALPLNDASSDFGYFHGEKKKKKGSRSLASMSGQKDFDS